MIADAAGLTNGALYRHFRTKADIYVTTFMETNGWMLERVSTAVSGAASLRETMLAVARLSRAVITETLRLEDSVGEVILEWGFEQLKVAGSTQNLLKYGIRRHEPRTKRNGENRRTAA